MTEVVERVADALVATRDQSKLLQARAAIEAMRVPTDAMLQVGVKAPADVEEFYTEDAENVFQAMIDEALK